MRMAIRDLLKKVAEHGLPGKHYFYIDFLTHYPGVVLSNDLREQYPQDMMISIQFDYSDLAVNDESFSVTLIFDEHEEHITVPFRAMTQFTDPHEDFVWEFIPAEAEEREDTIAQLLEELEEDKVSTPKQLDNQDPSHKVVSFDAFKKR